MNMQRDPSPRIPLKTSSDFNWLDFTKEHLARYNPDSHCCQRCGKRIWAKHRSASYTRGFIWPCCGKPVYDELTITTILCEQCGKDHLSSGTVNGDYHHAVLGGILIPFTAYSLIFILTVLDSYVNRSGTVMDVCSQWEISINTLYSWKKRYMDQYENWADSFHSIQHYEEDDRSSAPDSADTKRLALKRSLEWICSILQTLVMEYFNRFGYSFLQGCTKTHFRVLPVSCHHRI